MLKSLKALYLVARDALALISGGLAYAFKGKTPDSANQAMIRFFCRTRGRSSDLLTQLVSATGRKAAFPEPRGDLGVRSQTDADRMAESIRRDGYHIFAEKLSPEVCDRLTQFALTTPARVRAMTGEGQKQAEQRAVYDRNRPLAIRYDFDANDILACPDVQLLLASPSVLAVAQTYLNVTPIADVVSMWWHTSFSNQPDEEAAQFFHFDMDRIKWLKFFIYLTDVGPDNGPHCFIKGSHRTDGIPGALLKKGYARLSDEEVFQRYPREAEVQFIAPRGTVLAEDTRGLHKGKEVLGGDRLMLQIQFSNSLFGGAYPPSGFPTSIRPELAAMIAGYPGIYRNYVHPGGGR